MHHQFSQCIFFGKPFKIFCVICVQPAFLKRGFVSSVKEEEARNDQVQSSEIPAVRKKKPKIISPTALEAIEQRLGISQVVHMHLSSGLPDLLLN